MSSISGATQSYAQPAALFVDQQGPDELALSAQDGETGEINQAASGLTAAELEKAMLERGVAAQVASACRDIYAGTSTSSGAALQALTEFGGDAPLPEISGPALSPTEFSDKLNGAMAGVAFNDGTADLMWMALSTLATTSMRDIKDAKQIRNAMQQQRRAAGENEIKAAEKKIEEEKKAAFFNLCTSVVAAAASMGAGAAGAGKANMWTGSAQAVGGVVSALGQYANKASGPEAEVNKQQIREKVWQQQGKLYDEMVSEAESNYKDSQELFKLALRVMTEHVERETQSLNNLLR